MKAYVYVSLKRSVLDPQGKTIQGALQKLGYQGLQDVRQGKFFELTLDGGLDKVAGRERRWPDRPRSSDQSGDRRVSVFN